MKARQGKWLFILSVLGVALSMGLGSSAQAKERVCKNPLRTCLNGQPATRPNAKMCKQVCPEDKCRPPKKPKCNAGEKMVLVSEYGKTCPIAICQAANCTGTDCAGGGGAPAPMSSSAQ